MVFPPPDPPARPARRRARPDASSRDSPRPQPVSHVADAAQRTARARARRMHARRIEWSARPRGATRGPGDRLVQGACGIGDSVPAPGGGIRPAGPFGVS